MASDADKKSVFDKLHALKEEALTLLGAEHPFNAKLAAVFPALEVHVKADAVKTPE